MNCIQIQVFETCNHFISMAAEGYNCAIVSYGMAKSGKSFTLFGGSGEPGIVQHATNSLFNLTKKRAKKFDFRVSCWMACVSGDDMYDLLAKVGKTHKPMLGDQSSRRMNAS